MFILAACSTSTAAEIGGIWQLESFTLEGSTHLVEPGVNTRSIPWVEFADGQVNGDAGCNTFGTLEDQNYTVHGDLLAPADIYSTAMMCLSDSDADLNAAETAFLGVLWDEEGPIHVEVDGTTMTLLAGGDVLKFSRIETPPPPPTLAPQFSEGRLDCSPSTVVRTDVPDTGQGPEKVLRDLSPQVAEVVDDGGDPPLVVGL